MLPCIFADPITHHYKDFALLGGRNPSGVYNTIRTTGTQLFYQAPRFHAQGNHKGCPYAHWHFLVQMGVFVVWFGCPYTCQHVHL